jgi:hypothetical protein
VQAGSAGIAQDLILERRRMAAVRKRLVTVVTNV